MKVTGRACTMLLMAAASSMTASAFGPTAVGRTFVTASSRSSFTSASSRLLLSSRIQKQSSRALHRSNANQMNSPLTMLFGNLFGGGGAYGSSIAYDNLDFPGPELASAAKEGRVLTTSIRNPNLKLATFAGGCFWGLELAYQRVPGVVYTAVGYTQGPEEGPNYEQVCSGTTGHTEAVVVYYDPEECSYENLLDVYFGRVDPTTVNGQGNDFGKQYRTGVYYHTPEQEAAAKARFEEEAKKYRRPIASELKSAQPFWPAEKYHQQYLEK